MTCVAWFGGNAGGAFTFYPDGAKGRRESIPADHNTAIVLDTDKVFHGVERVKTASLEETSPTAIADVGSGASLDYRGGGQWTLETSDGSGVDFGWADLRYSISWKGYCFDSVSSHQKWLAGEDSLTIAQVQHIFEDDLVQRGIRNTNTLSPNDYAQLLVQTYVSFPQGAASF